MSEPRVVVLGGGHNGLVAAALLAKAGHRPLVLERRGVPGGAAVTEEIHPGFKVSALAHAAGPLLPQVAAELDLARHGLSLIQPDVRVFAPAADGKAITLYTDPARTAQGLAAVSSKDAARYPELHASLGKIGRLLAPLLTMTPPSVDSPEAVEVFRLLGLGRNFRKLPKRDAYRLLRWGPMAIADFAAEWFETELLRAVICGRGILGNFAGPWSAGTTANLLVHAAYDANAAGSATFVKGGLGALSQALAASARAAGAEIRTGAEVARILVKDGRATGVALASGEEIAARAVVSNADPKRTFLSLVDPMHLGPGFVDKVKNIRSNGVTAKLNFALSGLPAFLGARDGALAGRIHVGAEVDDLERAFDAAKYGAFSPKPYLDITIPSVGDPALAPAGRHVMSVIAHFAPYRLKEGDWSTRRDELAETVTARIEALAPGFRALVLARQVLTPADLEATYGLTGGHIHHGEHALDQLFLMRPVFGWARYRTPVDGLYLCGAGTHPGGGVTGAPGYNAAREILKDLKGK